MQTQKDHVEGYGFSIGRMTAALVDGDASFLEVPGRRAVFGLLLGFMIGVLAAGGFLLYGLIGHHNGHGSATPPQRRPSASAPALAPLASPIATSAVSTTAVPTASATHPVPTAPVTHPVTSTSAHSASHSPSHTSHSTAGRTRTVHHTHTAAPVRSGSRKG